MAQDNHDKAYEILVKYHGDGNPDSAIARLEMEEMLEVVSISGSDKRWWDFRDLFITKGARYRHSWLLPLLGFPKSSFLQPVITCHLWVSQQFSTM
jgi:hypothetical protein